MDMTAAQSFGDFHNSCRLCLSKGGRQLPIFAPQQDGIEPLCSRILACVSIQVHEDDDLPKQICHRCKCQINIWLYFKEECESSQRKLNNWNRTISRSFSHRDVLQQDDSPEIVSVKLESGGHDEYDIVDDECVDSEHLRASGDGPPLGQTDCISDDIMDCDDNSCLNEGHTDIPDAFSSAWNPVISGTSTVNVVENTMETREEADDDADDVGQASEVQRDDVAGSGGGEVRFIQPASPRSSILEINIEDDDVPPQALSHNSNHNLTAIPEFVTLNVSSLNASSISIDPMENGGSGDPLIGLKEEPIESSEVLFKVKEEPAETHSELAKCGQDDLFYDEQFTHSVSSTLRSILSSTPLNQSNRKKVMKTSSLRKNTKTTQSMPSARNDQVYNYAAVDLPKISNDLFDEETKYCRVCQKSFLNSNLWRHIKEKHAELNPFKCEACGKVFTGRRELVTHRVRTVNKCCRAGRKLEDLSASAIIIHESVSRGKRGRYECRECNLKFMQLSNIKAHVRIHTGEKPFFCYKCNEKEFRLRKSAYKHVSVCRPIGRYDNPAFVSKEKLKRMPGSVKVPSVTKHEMVKPALNSGKNCTKCGKIFTNGTGVTNHLRVECVRKCFACSKFVPKKMYHKHYRQCLKSIHSPPVSPSSENMPRGLASSQSSKIVSSNDNSSSDVSTKPKEGKIHPRIITKIVDLPVSKLWEMQFGEDGKLLSLVCQICHRTSSSRKGLRAHLMKHSSKSVKCELCYMRFSLHSSYESHMSNAHGGWLKVPKVDLDFAKGDLSSSSRQAVKPVQSKFLGFKTPKLKCEICLKLFSSAASLKYHKQTHKRIKCPRCEITFPATMEKSHICTPKVKVELPNLAQEKTIPQGQLLAQKVATQYTCQLCKKKFHTRKMLYQHKKMHIKMKIYKCKICGNSYNDAGALQQHKASAHASELALESESQEREDKVKFLPSISYEKKEEESKQYKCSVCQKVYTVRNSFMRHMKLHKKASNVIALQKPNEPGILFCNICDKAFTSKESFIAHKGWHSRQETGNLPVSSVKSDLAATSNEEISTSDLECSKVFIPDKTFDCDLCSKKFSTQKGLKCHAVSHDKISSKIVIKKENTFSSALPQTKTLTKMLHKCKICPKTFSDVSSLASHITTHSEHSGNSSSDNASILEDTPKELLQCKLCNKEYKCRKSLKYHMMGHSGEKPFKCRSCSNQYSNPKALSKHEKERHPVILRPFSCNRCKTSFILKEDLLAHHVKCTH